MLTAQRFQLSVLAGGEAERWPPISLNTWSPPSPLSLSLSLAPFFPLSLSLSLPLPLFFSLLIPGLARGLTALSVPACQKGPVIQHPPSGTGGNTHTRTHIRTHSCMNPQTRTLTEHAFTKASYTTHTHALSLSHSHTHTRTNIVPMPMKYLPIEKLLTALRGCSACCQHFSKYADILHALIRIKCIIHTDTNLLSFRLFHSSADTNSTFFMASSCQSM